MVILYLGSIFVMENFFVSGQSTGHFINKLTFSQGCRSRQFFKFSAPALDKFRLRLLPLPLVISIAIAIAIVIVTVILILIVRVP